MAVVGAITLDGKATRDEIFVDLTQRVGKLTEAGRAPGLGTILVGEDPGSQAYVRGKHSDCAKVGIKSIRRDLPADISQDTLDATIDELNANPDCTGYIVQLPLPRRLDENAALERVDPGKDADGLHPTNLGRLVLGKEAPLPCTPRGIVHLLRRFEVPIAGAHVVVIGRGVTVGRPIGLLLTRRTENATVTLCHTGTRDLGALTRQAISVDQRGRARRVETGVTTKEFLRKVFAGQWPILAVGLIFIAAFALVIAGYWRRGALVIGIGVGTAAILRLTLADDRAGLLVVRSRGIDFVTTATVCAAMFYIAWTIDPLGTS